MTSIPPLTSEEKQQLVDASFEAKKMLMLSTVISELVLHYCLKMDEFLQAVMLKMSAMV